MRRVAITGAGGLIGSALVPALQDAGWDVVPLSRAPRPGAVVWDPHGYWDPSPLEGIEAVVHLAGETIARRWTVEQKRLIRDSRVHGTTSLCNALTTLSRRPSVLACASAVGYYGDRGDELLTEDSSRGDCFLADVVNAWEAAAQPARDGGIRVVSLRMGMVLAGQGGALARMLLPFRLGLGGAIGGGRQYISWVALDDAVRAFRYALDQTQVHDAVNVVSPQPVTNSEFSSTLGRVLHRPAFVPLPRAAVRLLLGQMGQELLLSSLCVKPVRLLEAGFSFKWPLIEDALRHVLYH